MKGYDVTIDRGIWRDKRIINRLLDLRKKPGITARQMAEQLNEEFNTRFTKSAVVGKLGRMGYAEPKNHPTPNGARDDLVRPPLAASKPPPPMVKRTAPEPGARICCIEDCRGPKQPGKDYCNVHNPVPKFRRTDRLCAEIVGRG